MARIEVARLETRITTAGYVFSVLQGVNFLIFGLRSITFALEALSTNQLQGMTSGYRDNTDLAYAHSAIRGRNDYWEGKRDG